MALAVAAAALVLTSGPRLYLYLAGPPGHVFLGEVWGAYDIPRYVLLTRQAAAGAWLFDNRLQGPQHTHFLLYTPYVLLGHALGWTGISALAMLEIARWVAFPAALAAAWLFIRAALPPGRRALGYFCAVLAGGLGFLFLLHPETPFGLVAALDVTGPSFTVMNSLNMAPHVALAVAGLAVYFWGLLAAAEGRRRGLIGALGLGAVASFHAFVVPAALLAGGVFFLWRGRRREVFATLVLASLVSIPFGLYLLSLSATYYVRWRQDYAELENLPSLLASRALLWPFIVIGAVAAIRDPERRPGPALALCWAACALAFDLFPPFASTELHRTVEGSPLAFGVLAAEGLVRLARRWRTYLLAGAMVAPLLQSGLLVAAGPYQAEAFLPVDYYRLAARLDREGVTRCVFGADLTMLWVSALSQTCDAQTDITRLPGIFERLSTATPCRSPTTWSSGASSSARRAPPHRGCTPSLGRARRSSCRLEVTAPGGRLEVDRLGGVDEQRRLRQLACCESVKEERKDGQYPLAGQLSEDANVALPGSTTTHARIMPRERSELFIKGLTDRQRIAVRRIRIGCFQFWRPEQRVRRAST